MYWLVSFLAASVKIDVSKLTTTREMSQNSSPGSCSVSHWQQNSLAALWLGLVALFNFGCACFASLWWKIGSLQTVNIGVVSVLAMIYSCRRFFPSCRQAGSPGPTSCSCVDPVADGTRCCSCLWWERGVCIGDLLSTLLCCVSKESFYQFIQELTLPF